MRESEKLEVKWVTIYSALDENRMLATHGYINDGEGGNISLCDKIVVGDDYRADRFEQLADEGIYNNCCKNCLRKHMRLKNELTRKM